MYFPINLFFFFFFFFLFRCIRLQSAHAGYVGSEARAKVKLMDHTQTSGHQRTESSDNTQMRNTYTKGHPKPSERQVNMVCSWTMTFSPVKVDFINQPVDPWGPHAHSPWLADGVELLNHSTSWYVFWYVADPRTEWFWTEITGGKPIQVI